MKDKEFNNPFVKDFIHLQSTYSTNDYAKEIFDQLKNKTLIVADEQTAGRGRLDRTWFSPKKEALYFSLIIKKNITIEDLSFLNLISSLSVHKTIKEISGIIPDLKWPNDVYIKKKKIAGILIETIFKTDLLTGTIIGIGINLNIKEFPLALQSKATSLFLETNKETDNQHFLTVFINQFAAYFKNRKSKSKILKEWESCSTSIHNKNILVTLHGIPKRALTRGLSSQGYLLVQIERCSLTEITTADYLLMD